MKVHLCCKHKKLFVCCKVFNTRDKHKVHIYMDRSVHGYEMKLKIWNWAMWDSISYFPLLKLLVLNSMRKHAANRWSYKYSDGFPQYTWISLAICIIKKCIGYTCHLIGPDAFKDFCYIPKAKKGRGSIMKKLISKIASGYGKSYFWRLSYRPVPGDLKEIKENKM